MNTLIKILEDNRGPVKLIGFTNGCLSRDKFRVEFNPEKWGRKSCHKLETQIEKIWQQKILERNVYDGKKFRFGGIDINQSNSIVKIYAGLTSYKDIIGTSQAPNSKTWQEKGKLETGNPQAYMSDGLGKLLVTILSIF